MSLAVRTFNPRLDAFANMTVDVTLRLRVVAGTKRSMAFRVRLITRNVMATLGCLEFSTNSCRIDSSHPFRSLRTIEENMKPSAMNVTTSKIVSNKYSRRRYLVQRFNTIREGIPTRNKVTKRDTGINPTKTVSDESGFGGFCVVTRFRFMLKRIR